MTRRTFLTDLYVDPKPLVLSRESASDPRGRFASGAIASTRKQAPTATALGVQIQPLSQPLQEYPEMRALHRQLRSELGIPEGHTIQMLYRIGYADAAPHTLRRDVRDLLRRG